MLQNNLINRVFNGKKLCINQANYSKYLTMLGEGKRIILLISDVTDLDSLIRWHKYVWNHGFTTNLGPDKYGMFRCSDINTMQPSEVFLGGKYGLNIHPIPFWEEHKDEPLTDNCTCYEAVVLQYKMHLQFNIEYMLEVIQEKIKEYRRCGYTE